MQFGTSIAIFHVGIDGNFGTRICRIVTGIMIMLNHNKCVITNTCVQYIYGENKYLYQINSPKIRTIFTKLRVDSNCTRESRYRSYRGKKSENNLCPHFNVPQDVLHVLIHCDYPEVKRKRESFLSQYCTYARNYATKSETVQIRELLNIDPQCHEEDKLNYSRL